MDTTTEPATLVGVEEVSELEAEVHRLRDRVAHLEANFIDSQNHISALYARASRDGHGTLARGLDLLASIAEDALTK